MAKLLFHQGEIDICGNQMTGNRVFQSVGMLLFCRHPSFTCNRSGVKTAARQMTNAKYIVILVTLTAFPSAAAS